MDSKIPQISVRFAFQAEEDGEISIAEGEKVTVIPGVREAQEGWILVQKSDGTTGFVPTDYLHLDHKLENFPHQLGASDADPSQSYTMPNSPFTLSTLQTKQDDNSSSQDNNGLRNIYNLSINTNTPLSSGANTPMNRPNSPSRALLMDSSRLLKVSKTIKNAVLLSKPVGPSVFSLVSSIEKGNFEELLERNDDYFSRVLSSQLDTFQALTEMTETLSKKLADSTKESQDLVDGLIGLEELIDEERRKWKQQNEYEKNADLLSRTLNNTFQVTDNTFQVSDNTLSASNTLSSSKGSSATKRSNAK